MARIRTIKPEFWTDEDLSALPEATHMLAAALLNHADDEGYFNANPRLVQAACCPLREPSVSVHESLNLLAQTHFIELGTGTDGKRYGRVRKFLEHQRVNRPSPSKIKDLSIDWSNSVRAHGAPSERSSPEGNREQGKEQGKDSSAIADSSAPSADKQPKAELARRMMGIWNDELGDLLPSVKKLNKTRQQSLLARLREDFSDDLEQWRAFCQRIRGSPHLIGDNNLGWQADLDWCIAPSKFAKIMEGKYDRRLRNGSAENYLDSAVRDLGRAFDEAEADHETAGQLHQDPDGWKGDPDGLL